MLDISKHLVIGLIFLDNIDHMFEYGRFSDPFRNRPGSYLPACGPIGQRYPEGKTLLLHPLCISLQFPVPGDGYDAHGSKLLVYGLGIVRRREAA